MANVVDDIIDEEQGLTEIAVQEEKKTNKSKDIIVPVRNFCLIKHISGDGEGCVTLVGTLIQNIFDTSLSPLLQSSDAPSFKYRFNDVTADEAMVESRRLEDTREKNNITKETFQMNAPLETDVVFDKFPFKVVTASLLIELSTTFDDDNGKRIRPNILLATKDRRQNISVQKPYQTKGFDEKSEKEKVEMLKDKMDKSKRYEIMTPFPKVEYFYDTKKEYCPKHKLTFYLTEEGNSKLVAILAPMLLISTLNTLHVLNTEEPDSIDFIANAATFALTAVFILPSMVSAANRTALLTSNNFYIAFIFIGLALSSFPEQEVGTKNYAIAGMVLFWISFTIPIFHACLYWNFQKKISPTGGCLRIHDFISDPDQTKFTAGKDNYSDHFLSADLIEASEKNHLYQAEDIEKFRVLEYNDPQRSALIDKLIKDSV